jgi:predicted AlkP superfamily phosphohydrolase/phosphomutase
MNGHRTLVLAFDGLSFQYLDAFDLPAFESLRDRGVEASLTSTHPPWTGSAWPSMYTGTDPSHHGVYAFFDFEGCHPDTADIVSRTDVDAPALWNYLSGDGESSVVLNMPVTHPAEQIDGTLIPGYLAPEKTPGYPEGVRAELSDAIGEEYSIYATDETADDEAKKLEAYVDLIEMRKRSVKHLLANEAWELGVAQVQKTDAVFHNFTERDAFRSVYAAADDLLGSVLAAVDDDVNVVVCSDHGIGPNDGYVIHVNEVLRRRGFVETTTDSDTPSLSERTTAEKDETAEAVSESSDPSIVSNAVSLAERGLNTVGVTSADVYTAAHRLGVDSFLMDLLPEDADVGEDVDWHRSKAYCRIGSELGVRINLQGREPNGVVPQSEYQQVRDEILRTLSALRTPDGDPAFEWVKPREEVYDGAHTEAACDVLFRPAEMNHGVVASLTGRPFIPADKYNHKIDGVFIAAGPDIASASGLERLSLTDVAPTTMALLGKDVPARMTGTVPETVLDVPVSRREYADVPYGTDGDGIGEGDVEERLEDLGYI